jgi:APA family basic amino acid/polyamine antiporter
VLKLAALAALIAVGLSHLGSHPDHFQPLFSTALGPSAAGVSLVAALAVAFSQALFAYDSWNSVSFLAEEVRDPQRTLPRALFSGCLCVMLFYVLANIAYLAVLPIDQMARVPEQRVAQQAAQITFGRVGVTFVVVAILISTLGCVNGLILSGARVFYAMARENMFFRPCAQLHSDTHAPTAALIYQGAWSCVLALTGSYDVLLTYTTSAAVFFGGLTVASVFRLRRTQPDRPRPYRCWGYPFTPGAYILFAVAFLVYVVQGKPLSALTGFALVMTGIPFYRMWRRQGHALSEHGR